MKKILLKISFIGVLVGAIIGVILSFISYEAIEKTSNAEFCVKCHEMAPMRASFDQDIHGGEGRSGIRAKCVDCHLPQDSLVNYIFTKAVTGGSELVTHFVGDVEGIDWQKYRENRAHFVYDNACKRCHTNYDSNKKFSKKAIVMHKHYNSLKGTPKELGCASCHKEVGHNGLNNMLNIFYPKYPLYEKGSAKERKKIEKRLYQ